ncbi:MAG: transporter small permease [Clostridiales bacterium]|nr:transporter small permease [Clostridiales bacterium]
MYNLINKTSNYLNKVVEIIAVILIAWLTIITGYGIIARYLTGQPVIWLQETTVLSFAWATFLGVSIAFKLGDHIGLDILTKHVPRGAKKGYMIFLTLLTLVFVIYGIKEGYQIIMKTSAQYYQTINVSTAWFYGSFFASCLISLVHLIDELLGIALNKIDIFKEKEINLNVMG